MKKMEFSSNDCAKKTDTNC